MIESKQEIKKEILFSKVINKTAKNGRVVGSLAVEVIMYNDSKVIQLTKDVQAGFGKPAKRSVLTFDPQNKDIKEALSEAFKK